MKTYKDLIFEPHRIAKELVDVCESLWFLRYNRNAKHAVLFFDNGYGVSVVTDAPIITGNYKYECAVIKGTPDEYTLVYPDFAPDVVRMDTEEEINAFMEQIQRM